MPGRRDPVQRHRHHDRRRTVVTEMNTATTLAALL
jgi:hypothetical protein